MEELIKKACPICGKIIKSLYEKQLDYNFKAHLISCEQKDSYKQEKEKE